MVSTRHSFARRIAPLCALALVLLWGGRALAHQSSYTYGSLRAEGRSLEYVVRLSTGDLFEALGLSEDRDATDTEITSGGARLSAYVAERVRLEVPGQSCKQTVLPATVVRDGQRFARVQFDVVCPRTVRTTALHYELFFDLDPRHEGLLRVSEGLVQLTGDTRRYEHIWGQAGPSSRLGFLRSGALHVLYGLDHILFLISLLLVVGLRKRDGVLEGRALWQSVRHAALIASAFTVGHSLTLVSAALGWVSLPSRLVESAIAASIVFVAIENVLRLDPPRRHFVTLLFGLMHGLGFASMLRPLLSPEDLVVPLLVFNLGVEVGQLVVVVLALPVVVGLVRLIGPKRYARVVLPLGSLALALAGIAWFVERAFQL